MSDEDSRRRERRPRSHPVPASRRLAILALALASVTVSLLAVELVLRIVDPVDAGNSFEFRIPDRRFGWVLQPGSSYLNDTGETFVRVTYNSRGFRDVERSFGKANDVLRIVVLGDSYMEGYTVELDDSFHRRLEALARDQGYDVEVINLGVGGFGTLQEYLILQELGWRYDPDLVLLAFYPANDLRDNSMELQRLWKDDPLKLRARPFLLPGPEDTWEITQIDFDAIEHRYRRGRSERERLRDRLAGRSALVRATLRAERRIAARAERLWPPRREEDAKREQAARRIDRLVRLGPFFCSEPPEFTRAWETTRRILARTGREARARGTPLVVFSVPSMEELVLPEEGKADGGNAASSGGCRDGSQAVDRLSAILGELGIRSIDLLEPFRRAAREDGIVLFGRGDTHWNARGHDLAASTVLEALVECLPSADRSRIRDPCPDPTSSRP